MEFVRFSRKDHLQEPAVKQWCFWRGVVGRRSHRSNDAVLLSLLAFALHQFMQVALIAQRFPLRLPRHFFVRLSYRGQVQCLQTLRQFRFDVGRLTHRLTPASLKSWSKLSRGTSAMCTSVRSGTWSQRSKNSANASWLISVFLPAAVASSRRRASSTRASPSLAASSRISR